jgi:O-antigen ligase
LLGYGNRDPGWGAKMGMQFTDVNNEFIMTGVLYGMLGVIVLCVVLITAFRGLIRAWRLSSDVKLRAMYWSMGSILFAVIIAWMGVSFFGQMPSIFYSVLGMIGAFSGFAEHTRTEVNKHLAVNNVYRKAWI